MGDVTRLAGAVHDHEQRGFAIDRALVEEHQVVDDAAFVVQQQAVALLAHGQVDHVHGDQRLERGGGIRAYQLELAHVRDVEQAGGGACVVVLRHQAAGVLHGHGIAGERHHAGAQLDVQGVQGRGEQRGGGSGRGHGGISEGRHGSGPSGDVPRHVPCCPLYLRDSPRSRRRWRVCGVCSFGGWRPCLVDDAPTSLQPGKRPHPCGRSCQSFCLSVRAVALRLRRPAQGARTLS